MISRLLRSALLLAVAWAGSVSLAQSEDRAVAQFALSNQAVTGVWNELVVTVRDAPGAEVELQIDVGSALQPVAPWLLRASVPQARGVQSIRIPVAVPAWRAMSWKVTLDGRVLGSGTWSARERDDRRIGVVLSDSPARWLDVLPDGGRWISATIGDLPTLTAGWDAVDYLVLDSARLLPSDATLLAAAAAGVYVLVPQAGASLQTLRPSSGDPDLNIGAGVISWVAAEADTPAFLSNAAALLASGRPTGAWNPEAITTVVTATQAGMPRAGWPHLPRGFVAWASLGYLLLVALLLRVPARAGWLSAVMVAIVAMAASPLLQPGTAEQASEDRVVFTASGLGRQQNLMHLASHTGGVIALEGYYRVQQRGDGMDLPMAWIDGATELVLPAGGRVRLEAAPFLTEVPNAVGQASLAPNVQSETLAMEVLASVRDGLSASVVRQDGVWWWTRSKDWVGEQP